jgi:branched-subunit amino acid ABC-type transport system permease component
MVREGNRYEVELLNLKKMDILKTATEWAKAEIFSSSFFIVFGVLFVVVSIGFWQLGKTDLARAYIIPTAVAGVLLLTIGIGLVFTNLTRISSFKEDFKKDTPAFIQSEIERVDRTLKEYKTVVFTAIPFIIIVFALLLFFLNTPTWRAISITSIATLLIILFIDGTAHARMEVYKNQWVKKIESNQHL